MQRALLLALLTLPLGAAAQTVDDVVAVHRGGCTTAGVEGLSQELVRSHVCVFPGVVTEVTHPNVTLTSSRVHPLATLETAAAIRSAADRVPLVVTSAFRTLVEQYLLYHEGGCGLAAEPGNSNHQTGRAFDLSNYEEARASMVASGCEQTYPTNDPVHFDCPGPDMRSASVLVFQRLWNAHHPGDPLVEDGAYGPATAARLGQSPAAGFGRDLCPMRWGAELVASTVPLGDGMLVMHPGEELVATVELVNRGTAPWDARTRLATTEPRDRESVFAGPDWLSPSRAAASTRVEPGEAHAFTFTLRAPTTPGEHVEHFGLVQEEVVWFADDLGPSDDRLALRILVVPSGADAGISGGSLHGGCAIAPGSPSSAVWLLLVLLGASIRRSRR